MHLVPLSEAAVWPSRPGLAVTVVWPQRVFGWSFSSDLERSEKRVHIRLVEVERSNYPRLVLWERQPLTRSAPARSDFEVRASERSGQETGHVTPAAAVADRWQRERASR